LKNERSIENRVKELLRLVAGYELTEAPTLLSHWQT
jgi:hypothetical protein